MRMSTSEVRVTVHGYTPGSYYHHHLYVCFITISSSSSSSTTTTTTTTTIISIIVIIEISLEGTKGVPRNGGREQQLVIRHYQMC